MRKVGTVALLAHHEAKLRDLTRKSRQIDSWTASGGEVQFKEVESKPGKALPVLIR